MEDHLTVLRHDERDEPFAVGERPDVGDARRDTSEQQAGEQEGEERGSGNRRPALMHRETRAVCAQEGT